MDRSLFGQRGFRGIRFRQYKGPAIAGHRQRHRQRTAHRAQFTGQGQFAGKLIITQTAIRYLSGSGDDAQRNRQIEAARLFGQVSRCQIDGDTPRRKIKLGILQCRTHAILGFFHLDFGQADDREAGQSIGEMGLHRNQWGIHARQGAAVQDGQGHWRYQPDFKRPF